MASLGADEAAAPCGLLGLPDALLLEVLSRLRLQERLRGVALACRTLCSLALAPPLLQSVHVVLWGREDADQRLDSLCRWLQHAAAGRVRRLELELGLPCASRFDTAALQAALAAQSDLQELRLAFSGVALPLGGWMAALPLHTLCIDQLAGPLPLEALVRWPPGLQALRLHGRPLQLRADLPESLTRLEMGWLSGEDGAELPQQVSELTRLECLELWGQTGPNSRDLEPLSSLTRLSRLELRGSHDLGTILPLVPGLEEMSVGRLHRDTTVEALRCALEHVLQLTGLTASYLQDGDAGLLQALQGFTQLRLLSMSTIYYLYDSTTNEAPDMQAVEGISPDLRFQPDSPPDVHCYHVLTAHPLPVGEGAPVLPPALAALLQSAQKLANHIGGRGRFAALEFAAELWTTRRLPGEPACEAISRALAGSAPAAPLYALCSAGIASLIDRELGVDSCSSALTADLAKQAQAVAAGMAVSIAEVDVMSSHRYALVHFDLAFIAPSRVWVLDIVGED